MNGTATCVAGTCGVTCDDGYAVNAGGCVAIPAPRPIGPLSTATATSQQPTFHWQLPTGADGARLELCEDRACTHVIERVDVSGTSAAPTAPLAQNVVFWRLYGRHGSRLGTQLSATWELFIGAASAGVDTAWGSVLDLDGDGFADVAVAANALSMSGATARGSSTAGARRAGYDQPDHLERHGAVRGTGAERWRRGR